ncbi:MAG: thioredoxin fold domain-containing protein [Candidatus Methanofastidiosa archaeon]|nr:thioredoxin fold domain-containing protein [Candidatus Methanofastidiosa archaeon]
MRHKALLLTILLSISLLSGCISGGGGNVSTAPPTTPSTEPPPTTTPVPTTEAPTTAPPATQPPAEVDPPKAHGLVEWMYYDEAMENLMDDGKPILVYFWGVDCPFCDAMDENTFSDPEVVEYITQNFNPIEVNIYTFKPISQLDPSISGASLAQVYRLSGVPAYTFINYELEIRLPLAMYLDSEQMMIFLTFVAEEIYREMSLSAYIRQVQGQD